MRNEKLSLLKTSGIAAAFLLMMSSLAFGQWQADVANQQIYTPAAATNPKVGIGTTDPQTQLHIMADHPNIRLQSSATLFQDSFIEFGKTDLNGNFDYLGSIGNPGSGDYLQISAETEIRVNTNFINRLTISGTGNVGIGLGSPSHPLEMGNANGAHCTSGGVWTNASSREYKENIQSLSSEAAKTTLEKLQPVRFNYKADGSDEYVGFIAEDVPELVASKDRKGLSPMDIVAVLTRVVQHQQKQITALKVRLDEMQ